MEEYDRYGQALVALFFLGLVLFSPLLLDIFDGPQAISSAAPPVFVFGVPLLYLYMFVAWAGLIGLMALVVTRCQASEATNSVPDELRDNADGR